MLEVARSATFDRWLRKLKDRRAVARVLVRIDRLAAGNPGDVKPVGHGVSELRINYEPGYRVYFLRDGDRLILLLAGGDKSSQHADNRYGTPHRRCMAPRTRRTPMSADAETFAAFDAADYVASVDAAAAYLEALLDDGGDDPAVIARGLGAIARSRNFSHIARQAGVSREGLYKALSADGNPSLSTLLNVSRALGLRLRFEAAGRPEHTCRAGRFGAHRPAGEVAASAATRARPCSR